MSRNWLVTGSNRGLGLAIVRATLAAGDTVVATARDTTSLDALRTDHPGTLLPFALDVTDSAAAQGAVDFAIAELGRVDILVNNAGYAHAAPFELMSEADFRDQIDANFHGTVNLVRAVLPSMRQQRSGHIFNVSSVGGRVSTPGLSAYQAAKWAVSGFTEIVAREVAAFGVRAVSLEPGGMRTGWSTGAAANETALPAEYEPTVGATLRRLNASPGREVGDPDKIAALVVDLSRRDDLPYHLILGTDALAAFEASDRERQEQARAWLEVSRSTG